MYPYSEKYYSALLSKNELLIHPTTWVNLRFILLNERSCMTPFIKWHSGMTMPEGQEIDQWLVGIRVGERVDFKGTWEFGVWWNHFVFWLWWIHKLYAFEHTQNCSLTMYQLRTFKSAFLGDGGSWKSWCLLFLWCEYSPHSRFQDASSLTTAHKIPENWWNATEYCI